MAIRRHSQPLRAGPAAHESDSNPENGARQGSRDYDAEIERARGEAEALKGQMADALTAWLDATAPWAAGFWERSIAETVEENPDAVIALDGNHRKSAKDGVAELLANARGHIQRRLLDERSEEWPHLKPQTDPHDVAFQGEGNLGPFAASKAKRPGSENSVPEAVAGRLDGVLGDVASIAADHGLILEGFERGDPFGHKGRWHPDRQHKPEWSDAMLDGMAAYGELHDRFVAALSEASRISDEKKRLEASRLWETA